MSVASTATPNLTDPRLPQALYTAAQVREFDRVAIEQYGLPGAHLMQRAGRAAFSALRARWPTPTALHVLCGTGNNGGDGSVIAQLAGERGLPVTVWQVADPARIRGDAEAARACAVAAGVPVKPFEVAAFQAAVAPGAVLVDAMLGTGLGGSVREPFAAAIAAANASGCPIVAMDIPSGLCADTGTTLGVAIAATLTVTFIGLKRGLFTGSGPARCGELEFADLGVPAAVYGAQLPAQSRLLLADQLRWLAPRPRDAHKGHFGHAVIVGGDHGMAGAALMASGAAVRVGAGLVSCATQPEHAGTIVLRFPEVMARGVRSGAELESLLARASCLAVGPGLGTAGWGEQLLMRALASDLPLVLDADALNLLAERPGVERPGVERPGAESPDWILTPHPGEAARLLGIDTAAVQADRYAAAAALRERYGGVIVLKGAGTLVAGPAGTVVSNYGNPGMATGGMGDVLTGVIAGLLAQGIPAEAAARLGVSLHGRAADLAATDGERGMLATDLLPQLRRLVNP